MDTFSASVKEADKRVALVIQIEDYEVSIPLSDDNPIAIKRGFNDLILRLRKGLCQVELVGDREDLFSQVAAEYVKQLNKEMRAVREDIVEYGLEAE